MSDERNVLTCRPEDEDVIRTLATMSQEKKMLLKGIVIGLQLQGQQSKEIVKEAG